MTTWNVKFKTVANYDLRSKTGEEKRRAMKPLKWPFSNEWNLTPSEVLEIAKRRPTQDKYWKMTKVETEANGIVPKNTLFVTYRKPKEILMDNIHVHRTATYRT